MNISQIPNQDQRYDESSLWLTRLDRGLSHEEEKSLRAWLDADPENRAVFLEMARLWDRIDTVSCLSELFPRAESRNAGTRRFIPAVAVSLLLAAVLGIWMSVRLNTPELSGAGTAPVSATYGKEGVYKTVTGERTNVQLADGTRLALNTDSLVRVDYTDRQRFLILERGEVYVDVARDATRPLTILAGEQLVQAVGTAFNIELRSDQDIELVVTKGKVLVGVRPAPKQRSGKPAPVILPPSSRVVAEGEQIILGSSGEQVEKIEPDEISVKLSWRKGNLIFRGESLDEAVAEIGRYTTVEFVILDENLKKIQVVGLFKAGDVDGLLATLRQNFNVTSQRREGKILLGRSQSEQQEEI